MAAVGDRVSGCPCDCGHVSAHGVQLGKGGGEDNVSSLPTPGEAAPAESVSSTATGGRPEGATRPLEMRLLG